MAEPLLILGASVRAAAQSAARAGFRPYCGDLFQDADLPDAAVGQVVHRFPDDLRTIAAAAPPCAWMYTGGLENYPRLVERISRRHRLLGTGPDCLKRVRDPMLLGQVLAAAGLLFPACRAAHHGLPTDGSWLVKHCRSSGGMRVGVWRGGAVPSGGGWYYQQRINGSAHGAVFIAAGGEARLLGITRQILNAVGNRPFQYAGSIGPVVLSSGQQEAIRLLGDALAAEFRVRGLFGVDLIIRGEEVWAVDVNPRYTASVEVLERSLNFNAIGLHRATCETSGLPAFETRCAVHAGKRVLYADQSFEVTAALADALLNCRGRELWPAVADIPRRGTSIRAGQPVLTVFAQGDDLAAVDARLQMQAQFVFDSIRSEQTSGEMGGWAF